MSLNRDFQNGFERVSAALLMVWGPSARILDVESEGMFKAVPSLAIDTLFQVERSSADMSLDSHASLREFQKLTRFGMARPPLSKGS